MNQHPVEKLWREHGLPEYFLGNGGTNTKLYALYEAIREQTFQDAAKIPEHWIGTWQDEDIQYTSARDYAVDAMDDVAEVLRTPELRAKALSLPPQQNQTEAS